MRIAEASDLGRLEDARVFELNAHSLRVKVARDLVFVGPNAPDEMRRPGDHLGEQVHERVAEVGRDRGLSSALTGRAALKNTKPKTSKAFPKRV